VEVFQWKSSQQSSGTWFCSFVNRLKLTFMRLKLYVLYCLIHAVAGRTFPAGERGSAAGSLLSSHYPNYTWACVLCRPSPEFPFRFIWVLGWSFENDCVGGGGGGGGRPGFAQIGLYRSWLGCELRSGVCSLDNGTRVAAPSTPRKQEEPAVS
jgi:hypothetical protein